MTRKHTYMQFDGGSSYQWLAEFIDKWDTYTVSP